MTLLLDVMERAFTGKPCTERDYDLNIFSKKLKEIVKEYDIKYDPDNPVPSDNSVADDVFNAGFDFFCEVGSYFQDTGRVIKFSEDEIKKAIKSAPSEIILGEGTDAKKFISRKPESNVPPWCFIGAGGAPISSDEYLLKLVEAYGSIPLANSITIPSLTSVSGSRIRPGTPLEMLGAIRNIVLAREALRRAGRPGLPIMNSLPTAQSSVGLISALHPEYGLRKTDGYLVAIIAELKTNFDLLNKVCMLQTLGYGNGICGESGPVFGGFSGGAEGTVVTTIASHLMGLLLYNATWHLTFPIHLRYTSNSNPELLWVTSVYAQAISRNTHLLSAHLNYTAAGPGTKMCFREIAAQRLAAVSSGVSIESVGIGKAKHEDYLTPIEPRFAAEVANAAAGMKREDANEIVKELLSSYLKHIPSPPLGYKYQECHDTKTGKPLDKCLKVYNDAKKELENLGLNL